MEHPVLDFHDQVGYRNAKSPASAEAGLAIEGVSDDQPRVRERIMKLSKVYSAYSAVGVGCRTLLGKCRYRSRSDDFRLSLPRSSSRKVTPLR
jgi:hypothetical protein